MANTLRGLALALILLVLSPAMAMADNVHYQIWTVRFNGNYSTGIPIPGASTTVYQRGTTTKASLYDASGKAISNPFISDANAIAGFWAAGGASYDVVWSSGAYISPTIQPSPIISARSNTYSVLDFGASCSSSSLDDGVGLANAAAANALRIPDGASCYINANTALTAPALRVGLGSKIYVGSGVTLTINAMVDAKMASQIFYATGANNGTMGSGKIVLGVSQDVLPEWWGAKGDSTTINNVPWQQAANAISGSIGGTLRVLRGQYKFDCSSGDAVTVTGAYPINIIGLSQDNSILRPTTNCAGNAILSINPSGNNGEIANLQFNGAALGIGDKTHTWTGLKCLRCGVDAIHDIYAFKVGTGIDLQFYKSGNVYNTNIQYAAKYCYNLGGSSLANGGAIVVSSLNMENSQCATIGSQATSFHIGSGTSEVQFRRTYVAGSGDNTDWASVGILIDNLATSGYVPGGLRFFAPNIDRHARNVYITAGWNVELHGGEFGQNSIGNIVADAGANGVATVRNLRVYDSQVRPGGQHVIDFIKAADLLVQGSVIFDAGGGGTGALTPNTYSSIHVGSAAIGTVDIEDNEMCAPFGESVSNRSKYALQLDAGALTPTTDGYSILRPGALTVKGNHWCGMTEELNDGSTPTTKNIQEWFKSQTVSAVNEIDFTALPTAYRDFRLECSGLTFSAANKPSIQTGQGATPTWNTTGYTTQLTGYSSTGTGAQIAFSNTSTTGLWLGVNQLPANSTFPLSFTMWLRNHNSTSQYKTLELVSSSMESSANNYETVRGHGAYLTDTNAITALRIIPQSGTESGSCSLTGYAMQGG
jgi:hypothetical protein